MISYDYDVIEHFTWYHGHRYDIIYMISHTCHMISHSCQMISYDYDIMSNISYEWTYDITWNVPMISYVPDIMSGVYDIIYIISYVCSYDILGQYIWYHICLNQSDIIYPINDIISLYHTWYISTATWYHVVIYDIICSFHILGHLRPVYQRLLRQIEEGMVSSLCHILGQCSHHLIQWRHSTQHFMRSS